MDLASWFDFPVRCALLASVGALLGGYDIGATAGIITWVKEDLKSLQPEQIQLYSSMMEYGCGLGALTCFAFADRIGRRLTFLVVALVAMIGLVMQISARSASHFGLMLTGRLVAGLAGALPAWHEAAGARHDTRPFGAPGPDAL